MPPALLTSGSIVVALSKPIAVTVWPANMPPAVPVPRTMMSPVVNGKPQFMFVSETPFMPVLLVTIPITLLGAGTIVVSLYIRPYIATHELVGVVVRISAAGRARAHPAHDVEPHLAAADRDCE